MHIESQKKALNIFVSTFLFLILAVPITAYLYNTGYFEQFVNKNECDNILLYDMPTAALVINNSKVVSVEVPSTLKQAQQGLMCRKSLNENEGMFFVFNEDQDISLWMRNTFIPLDVIYIDKEGYIVGTYRDTKPLSDDIIHIGIPSRMALEVNSGFVDTNNIKIGDHVRF